MSASLLPPLSAMEDKNGPSRLRWPLSRLRVALAVALIRTKPPGSTARAHAEALAAELKAREAGWKREALELREEVLRLRRELLMSGAGAAAAGPDPASQDLFGPECVAPSPDPQPDSDTPERLDAPSPAPRPQQRPLEALPHVRLLGSLCALRRVRGDDRGLEPLWFPPGGHAGPLLADCVCQLLDSFVKACKEPPPRGPAHLGLQACRAVAQATDLVCSRGPPSADFRRRVESSLEALTEMLLLRDLFSQLPAAETLTECLIVLGSSGVSKSFLIRHVLTRLSGVADQLWQVFQDEERSAIQRFPLDQYQNSFHLFRIAKTLLQNSEVPYRAAVGSESTAFLAHLERRVFLLSEEFPLFSMHMWMIGGLLPPPGQTPAP